MKWMVASVATIALAAGTGFAQPGNGNDRDNGKGAPSAITQADPGKGDAMRANSGNGNNGNGAATRIDRGGGGFNSGGPPMRVERGNGVANAVGGGPSVVARDNGNGDGAGPSIVEYGPTRYIDRDYALANNTGGLRGLIDGCPPGLAEKYNGCRPPGQVSKGGFLRRDAYGTGWWGLPQLRGGNYRYDSGYLLRMGNNGGVSAYIPLLGGALSIGNVWPNDYGYTGLSPYYQNYYGLGMPDSYRYADNVVYRLDPETTAITSVAALLTGDDFVIGQPVPRGYDIYNVPPSYRDRYYDTPEAHYRYSDGYIYQIDPETRLVAAAIELLVS